MADHGFSLDPTSLLVGNRYLRRTCGMSKALVSELRQAMSSPDPAQAQMLCDRIVAHLGETNAAVVIAPAVGRPCASASCGELAPAVVVWLLLDPTDIDSKQTTFVVGCARAEHIFQKVYKLSLDATVVSPSALPTVNEDRDDIDSLSPARFLNDGKYHRRTCGMEKGLVSVLRQTMNSQNGAQIQQLCDRVLDRLRATEANAAVLIAPPMGEVHASAACGDDPPAAVIWLLLDPTDIDSKQTTFVVGGAGTERTFEHLYKFSLDVEVRSRAALPSVAEDGDDDVDAA